MLVRMRAFRHSIVKRATIEGRGTRPPLLNQGGYWLLAGSSLCLAAAALAAHRRAGGTGRVCTPDRGSSQYCQKEDVSVGLDGEMMRPWGLYSVKDERGLMRIAPTSSLPADRPQPSSSQCANWAGLGRVRFSREIWVKFWAWTQLHMSCSHFTSQRSTCCLKSTTTQPLTLECESLSLITFEPLRRRANPFFPPSLRLNQPIPRVPTTSFPTVEPPGLA
jgi:hypothetical protein